ASLTAAPYFGYDANSRELAFGAVPATLDKGAWIYGLRAAYRARLRPWATLNVGVDWMGTRSSLQRDGSLTLPPREGDLYVFGTPPGPDVAHDEWTTHVADIGPHLSLEFAKGPVRVVAGLRGDVFLIEASRLRPSIGTLPGIGASNTDFALDPRVAATIKA